MLSSTYDLALLMPKHVGQAIKAAEGYRLFFSFEAYLRELVVDVLSLSSKDSTSTWWEKVPKDVQDEATKMEETEEAKRWMALGSRDKSALMTYPQLLRVIDVCWKDGFDELLRDKGLLTEARILTHLRNTLCHMTAISEEEMERIRQTMRDWFRVVAP
jgi:Swt1-like HEPN